MIDLVLLAPDKNAEAALRGILSRHASLGIRAVSFKIFVHPERDPGCRARGHAFLKGFQTQYAHALLIFDRQGCGREDLSREELECHAEEELNSSGWGVGASCAVIDPELDVWVWAESPHVATCLGWTGSAKDLQAWLSAGGLWSQGKLKPEDPKGALEHTLRKVKKPRSSSIYLDLANTVSLRHCKDPGFVKLRNVLQSWFSAGALGVPDGVNGLNE